MSTFNLESWQNPTQVKANPFSSQHLSPRHLLRLFREKLDEASGWDVPFVHPSHPSIILSFRSWTPFSLLLWKPLAFPLIPRLGENATFLGTGLLYVGASIKFIRPLVAATLQDGSRVAWQPNEPSTAGWLGLCRVIRFNEREGKPRRRRMVEDGLGMRTCVCVYVVPYYTYLSNSRESHRTDDCRFLC